MSTSKRKERELKQREKLILDTAYKMMLEGGYIGLTIDKIAEAIDYSKGTVYLHFKSKEDILVSILAREIKQMQQVKEKISLLDLQSRDLMIGMSVIGRAFDTYHPGIIKMQQALMEPSVWKKASEENKNKIKDSIQECAKCHLELMNNAIANDELNLTILSLDEVSMGLLAMDMGMMSIATEIIETEVVPGLGSFIGGAELDAQVKILHTFLDGLGWKPLFKDGNYFDVCTDIINEIEHDFPRIAEVAHEINRKVNKK